MNDITESELIAAIIEAQAGDDGDLPRCGPGEICPAILKWKGGLTDGIARRTIEKAHRAGLLEPAMITYIDHWGRSRGIAGYKVVTK